MKKIYPVLVILFIAALYYCNTDHEPGTPISGNPNTLIPAGQLLAFTDYQCRGELEGLAKGLLSPVYVVNHFMNDDTLTLRIHYEANCCPAFVVDAVVSQGNIVINIDDTLRICKCMCPFENDFKFLYLDKGNLRLVFQWWDIDHESLTTYMDTTIVIN